MATLEMNINQVNSDFQKIKSSIVNSGVVVEDETPTSELANKVSEVYNKGFTDGKKAEYDAFWDTFQNNGNRTNYNNAFNEFWNETNFKPKYDIKVVGSAKTVINALNVPDVEKTLNDCGVKLDTSQMTTAEQVFYGSGVKVLPVIDLTNATSIYYTFNNMHTLVTIRKIILPKNSISFQSNFFNNCSNLANVEFEGAIYQNFKISGSGAFSHDSLISLINALADYSGTSTTYTLTIGSTNLAKLTDEEKAIATQKGWTLA